MTFEEIQDLYIAGALTDRRLPPGDRPKPVKSMSLPYIHDWEAKLGWDDARHAEDRAEFWDERTARVTAKDVTQWERSLELIVLVDDEKNRRCLFAWAKSKAGGKPFTLWCRREGIHVETGRRRKDRAVSQIEAHFVRNVLKDNGKVGFQVLPDEDEIGHIADRLAIRAWQDEAAVLARDSILSGWRGIAEARKAERRMRART